MIAVGHSVDYGAAIINYTMTKEKAVVIRMHNVPEDLSPESVWSEMQLHQRLTRNLRSANHRVDNNVIKFEISPQNKETDGWSPDDYRRIIDELNEEMKVINYDAKTGKKVHNFDLDNTQYIAAIHYDSKSGIRHLHLVANRIDMDGQVIDDHRIGERLMQAVHVVNVRHGWELPEDIHEEHLRQINEACMDILQRMPRFDWDLYEKELAKKGLRLKVKRDRTGQVVSYVIMMGNSKFKASELGISRNLTVKNIESTWNKLHLSFPSIKNDNATEQRPEPPERRTYTAEYDVDGERIPVKMEQETYDTIAKECEDNYDEDAIAGNVEDLTKTAVLLFLGFVNGATSLSASCGGGGSHPGSGWGRDPKEDELEWARRCAQMARQMNTKPIQQTRSFRR